MVGSFGSGTELTIWTVRSSIAVASRLTVVAKWLIHSWSRDVLIVHAMSSAVSGSPSDHFSPSRNVYVYVSPSSDASHDSARPGIVAKSSAALSVSVAYWRFHSSYDDTRYPAVTFGLSRSWSSPT